MSYNSEVLKRLRIAAVAAGLCQTCRCRPQKPGRKTCQSCLDATNQREAQRVARGLCRCGRNPGRYASCSRCRDTIRAGTKRLHAHKIEIGECLYCKLQARPNRRTCAECGAHQSARKRRKYRQRAESATEVRIADDLSALPEASP